MIRIERIASVAALLPCLDAWNRLAGELPFRRWEWLGAWWEQFGAGHELYVLAARDEQGEIVGLAPWYQEQSVAQGRVVRWLGSGDACSDYLSLLTVPEHRSAVVRAIADWLAGSADGESTEGAWDLLKLEAVETNDQAVAELVQALADQGHTVHRRPGPTCWRVPLPASWDDYLSSISKPNRRKVRWAEKQFQPGGKFTVGHVESLDHLDPAWQTFVDLHQRRRQSIGQPGCFTCERFERFLRSASERLLAGGRARLVTVEKQGEPLAVELHLCDRENTYAYQVGISPDHLADNPGWLVNTASLLAAHRAGQRGFDLLRGDEPYKSHLGAEPRGTADLRVVSRRVRAQLRSSAWLAGDALRGWIKGGLELTGLSTRV